MTEVRYQLELADLAGHYIDVTLEFVSQAHQPVVLGAVAQQLYQAMSQRGDGGKDFSAIINSYRKPAIEGQR